jgi:transcriptional antiterminator RfaH
MKSLDTAPGRDVSATAVGMDTRLFDCGSVEKRWYAVQFNPGEQHLARPALHRLGYTTFLPLIRLAIPDKRVGKRVVEVPAFPGYLFAQWGPGSFWQRILSQPGVAGILHAVGDRASPLAVPPAEIAALLSRASAGGVIEDASVAPVLPALEAGQTVRVTDGPFAGQVGLCRRSSAERVSILLTLMGCERAVTAKRRYVEAV